MIRSHGSVGNVPWELLVTKYSLIFVFQSYIHVVPINTILMIYNVVYYKGKVQASVVAVSDDFELGGDKVVSSEVAKG